MAIIKRLTSKASASAGPSPSSRRSKVLLNLEDSRPATRLKDYSTLIYGAKGIGKTTLAAQFPGAVFINTEPGTKALSVPTNPCPDWDTFIDLVDQLVELADKEITVVVDVVDLAYDYIYDAVCRRQKIESPTDENDFGATWRKIKKGFREQIQRLVSLPGGCILLSHDVEKELELRDGSIVDRVQPTMGKQALGETEGIVDIVGCYAYDGEERVLHLRGSQTMVAKCRPEKNFIALDGKPVKTVQMGSSPKEAYQNLVAAFENKQTTEDGRPAVVQKSGSRLKMRKG
jgi:hypothetical protein